MAQSDKSVLFWRRTDVAGLERLELTRESGVVRATSTVLCLESGGFRLDHCWHLNADWHAQCVTARRSDGLNHQTLRLERDGHGWRVDGVLRPDLDGAEEPDLSVTPFCNSFPIRRMPCEIGATVELDTAFVDGASLTVSRSRQRYERVGPRVFRYVDLGLSRGFEAELVVDEDGLIVTYEYLFSRVYPGG